MVHIYMFYSVNHVIVRVQLVLEIVLIVLYVVMVFISTIKIVLLHALINISLLQAEDVFFVEMIVVLL